MKTADANEENEVELVELKLPSIILPIGWVMVYSNYYTGTDGKVYLV